MRAEFAALRALPWHERLALAQAWLVLLVIDAALRWLPFAMVLGLLARRAGRRRALAPVSSLRSLPRLVNAAAARHIRPMRCLHRSLALQWLLARRGLATELRFGVAGDDEMRAHSWLELRGRPLFERADLLRRFHPLHAVGAACSAGVLQTCSD